MGSPLRFIVIERDSDLRVLYARKLQKHFAGCVVQESESGMAALDVLSQQIVDAVVLNQRTSDLEGVPLIATIRERHPQLPLVAIGDPPLRQRAVGAGANAYVDLNHWHELPKIVEGVVAHRLKDKQS
jgi:DNA-binding NtrC family response regulator